MVERCEDARFSRKPSQSFRIGGEGWRQNLDRNVTTELLVACPVDLSHAARTNSSGDHVWPDNLPYERIAARHYLTHKGNSRSTQEGRAPVVFEQRLDFAPQGIIPYAHLCQERSSFGRALSERVAIELLDRRPALRRHAGDLRAHAPAMTSPAASRA